MPRLISALLVIALLLTGCGAHSTPAAAPTALPAATAAATSAPEPIELTETAPPQPPTATVEPSATSMPADTPTSPPTATPAPTATPIPTSTPAPSATPAPAAARNANLRAGPGTDYPVVGQVTSGQLVEVRACNPEHTWYQLGAGQWILADFVQHAPDVPVADIIPTPPPTNTPIPPTWTPAPLPTVTFTPAFVAPTAAPRVCCKICTTGKACGNSCISRNYTCHQPPGCACDG
jgi:hypothetical protein